MVSQDVDDTPGRPVALDSPRTTDIETFVPADSLGWIWVWHDKPHFLMPGDQTGQEAYAVIRSSRAATGAVGFQDGR